MASLSYLYQGIVVPLSILIPIVAAISNTRYTNSAMKALLVYILFAGVVNGCAAYLAFQRFNNLTLLHLYTPLEVVLLLRFFSRVLLSTTTLKYIKVMGWTFPLLCLVNYIFYETGDVYNAYTRPLGAIIIIVCSMFFLKENEDNYYKISKTRPEMWVVIGLLLYFSGSFFQFTFSNYISQKASHEIIMLIWNIHATLVFIMYLLFTKGFIDAKRDR
ncbi:hypothetical protein ACSBL2_19020 [Pedobacter sp. AW31-3R]|uniref:hypothetical protein n=1 Tax=Pedobacter sp. AW31-3R TaxID=3445781 RepID=UPI003FA12976